MGVRVPVGKRAFVERGRHMANFSRLQHHPRKFLQLHLWTFHGRRRVTDIHLRDFRARNRASVFYVERNLNRPVEEAVCGDTDKLLKANSVYERPNPNGNSGFTALVS